LNLDKTGQPLNKTRLFGTTDPTFEGCPVWSGFFQGDTLPTGALYEINANFDRLEQSQQLTQHNRFDYCPVTGEQNALGDFVAGNISAVQQANGAVLLRGFRGGIGSLVSVFRALKVVVMAER
jgi:hypothetical protein